MATTTISTKGQVILRDELSWGAGTRLDVEHVAGGVLLKHVTRAFAPTRPEEVSAASHTSASRNPWTRWTRGSPRRPPVGMRAVDTDVVVRYLLADDAAQAVKARAALAREPVFVPRTVMRGF